MFEAIIYDYRDRTSEHPESTLGCFEIKADAWLAIAKYMQDMPDMLEWIERTEVRLCE